jgi:hypothetical protein
MEKRPILLLLGILAAGALLAEEAYMWTDEDGIVHYSDRPEPGAKKIYLPEPNASRSLSRSKSATPAADDESEQPEGPFRYESLAVASPAAEATLWNIEGALSVSLSLNPALQQGHQVRVYFDGTPQMVSGTSFQLQEVWRGEHNLQAEVVDATGKLMIRSKPIRFYVQQSTVF